MFGARSIRPRGSDGSSSPNRSPIASRALLLGALTGFVPIQAHSQDTAPAPRPACTQAAAGNAVGAMADCTAPAAAATPVTTLHAQSGWLAPLGSRSRGPASSLLATVCLAWLALLLFATVVRPRGWHHKPLFPGLPRKS